MKRLEYLEEVDFVFVGKKNPRLFAYTNIILLAPSTGCKYVKIRDILNASRSHKIIHVVQICQR